MNDTTARCDKTIKGVISVTGKVVCRLSALLGERKMKMMDLARATGLSKTTVFQLYHEKATKIGLDVLAKICAALDCQPGDLLVYVPEGDKRTGNRRGGKPTGKGHRWEQGDTD
jgi:putative transcriptional regulator